MPYGDPYSYMQMGIPPEQAFQMASNPVMSGGMVPPLVPQGMPGTAGAAMGISPEALWDASFQTQDMVNQAAQSTLPGMQPAASFGSQFMGNLTSPFGLAGSALALANTDWSDPSSIGSSLGGIGGAAAGGAAGASGAAGLAALGSAAGPIGTLIGGAIGAIGGGSLGGLFGDSKEEKEEKKRKKQMRLQQFIQAVDNMATETRSRGLETRGAMDNLTEFFNRKNAAQARGMRGY